MKALVVYDSFFGNTEKVAQAIFDALSEQGDVQLQRVSNVKPEQLTGFDLLIVGSPTRKFSASPDINNFLKEIPSKGLEGIKVAVFDTRIPREEIEKNAILRFFVKIFGYAAEPVADRLKVKGGKLILPPEGFYVNGTEGPMLEGELERAGEWAKKIAMI